MDSVMPSSSWEWSDVVDGTPLQDKRVQNHVSRAYALLLLASSVASVSAYATISVEWVSAILMSSFGHGLLGISTFVLLMAVQCTHGMTKLGLFAGFAAAIGASLGPLISLAVSIDPAILVNACLLTAIVFASFTVIASLTSSRPMLWLGAPLASIVFWMMIGSTLNRWFFGSSAFFMTVDIYLGLFVFCGFVIFDTQLLIARAKAAVDSGVDLGVDDAVRAATELFLDLVNIFVRILVILIKNSANKKKRDDRD